MTMLIETYRFLLVDICSQTGIHLDVPDDMHMSWVLIEGPQLDKQLLQWLEHEETERPLFPEWLSPLWEAFLSNREARMLRALRQVLVFCYKAEFEPSDEQIRAATEQFVSTDELIDVWDQYFVQASQTPMFRVARQLVGKVIYRINWLDIIPSHGPGAVFPSCAPCDKSKFNVIYPKLNELYPFDQYFCGLPSFWWEVMVANDCDIVVGDRLVSSLTAVPKDSRGPRMICVHPKEAIWIQQGQRRLLEQAIHRSPITSKFINFDDQTINGKLALESSRTKEYCTLDLKEASDRISVALVRYLFGDAYRFFDATRADDVVLPDGRVHRLRKFAPMGNCLTFPVQSLVFCALVRAGILCHYGINCSDVYVFGDDIIYPSKYHDGALNGLTRAGLVPNMGKTFRHGSFRESCGVDAFNGVDITPLRMKVAGISCLSDVVSLCDLAKRLRLQGFTACSSLIYSKVRQFMGVLHLSNNPLAQGIFEYVKSTREVLLGEHFVFNASIQRWETRVALVQGSFSNLETHDWYHVQDSLLLSARAGNLREEELRYPVPYRERLTYGWTELLFDL